MTNSLRAFHGKAATKAKYLKRVRAHAAADQIIHGIYWENGKGCAVGCTIHSNRHEDYESELGIPEILARLEDRIFEGMGNGSASKWPAAFLSAIKVGAALSCVGPKFLLALQERNLANLKPETFGVREAIEGVITVLRAWASDGTIDRSAAESAESAAASAAASAESAESAAWSAAESAWSAWSAAESAWSAWSAAESAESAAASAESAASAEYEWQSQALLTLLRAAPVLKSKRRRRPKCVTVTR